LTDADAARPARPRRLRVLYLNPTVAIGGAERSLLELVAGVGRDRVEPLAACIAEGPLPEALREAGARVVLNPFPAFALKIGRGSILGKILAPLAAVAVLPHVFRLARLARREGIDILHTNGLKSHVVGSLASLLARRPVVWHVRDVLRPGLTRRAFGILARWTAARVVANSRATAAAFPGLAPPRLRVVYNGLDAARYSPGPRDHAARASLGASEEDFLVGAVGALAPLKGHVHLIRAAPRILERCPAARFVIVGEEMYLTAGHRGHRALLEAEARRLGVAGRVLLAGRRDDPVEVIRSLDVLVHASIYPESFGRVLVEAMACGVPVVATALGGPTEIVAAADQGILIPAGDPDAIAEAVLRLHGDPGLRARLSAGGRARVVAAFSVDRCVREIEAIYRELSA
jgi:glycosyltransferase involved in cell wall biosynthesis